MGKIFYVMGKSASGKDTVYKLLLERNPDLKTVVLYTTRPAREGEQDGVEYHFSDEDALIKAREEGRLIEARTYDTVFGPWSYFTVDDGQFDLKNHSYLMIGTLESFEKMQEYFGRDVVIPFYICVEDGLRLERALSRERMQKNPKYSELCRRYLADEKDFCEENLKRCGITRRYENVELEDCLKEIIGDMKRSMV